MMSRIKIVAILLSVYAHCTAPRSIVEYCPHLPDETLSIILGPAFNPRYMSVEPPGPDKPVQQYTNGYKRASVDDAFFVSDTYEYELSEKPAWEIKHHMPGGEAQSPQHAIEKRELSQDMDDEEMISEQQRKFRQVFLERVISFKKDDIFKSRPWECQTKVRWMDLGPDYYPRYIRSVECTKKECWYGHYTCRPKSFTIKVLRRKSGQCARISQKSVASVMISMDSVSGEFTELWVWEEKAVNFCCDCVMTY